MGGYIVYFITMAFLGSVYVLLGIFSLNLKSPMWFWSGSKVNENEIKDIKAYNRANGIMWISFGTVFWINAFLGKIKSEFAEIFLTITLVAFAPLMIICYKLIYKKYKA